MVIIKGVLLSHGDMCPQLRPVPNYNCDITPEWEGVVGIHFDEEQHIENGLGLLSFLAFLFR